MKYTHLISATFFLSQMSLAHESSSYTKNGFQKAPEYYISEPGDTLKNIAEELLGLPEQWKLLWKLNDRIKDPDHIPPGTKIIFKKKEIGHSKKIKSLDQVNFHVDSKPFRPELTSKAHPPVPEAFYEDYQRKYEELSKPQKVDFVGYDEIPINLENIYDKTTIYKSDYITVTVPGFILSDEPENKGVILGGQTGEELSSIKQDVVGVLSGKLEMNKVYSVIRYIQDVVDQDEGYVGKLYHFVGNIRPSSLLNDGLFFQASVEKIRSGLKAGDLVVPFLSTKREILTPKTFTQDHSIGARIVAFEDEGQEIGGLGSFVFIDKGSNDSLKIGQIYEISQNILFSEEETGQANPESVFNAGFLKIVDVTPVGSTGIIVSNRHEVMIGDFVGR